MRLLVDDREVRLDRPTLAAAIATGAGDAHTRGRIVVEIKADGISLADHDIESASDVPGSVQEVRLLTTSRAEMGAEVLLAAKAALADLGAAQRHVADQILATRLELAASSLQQVLNTWQGAREAVEQVCLLLGTDLPALASNASMSDEASDAVSGLTMALAGVRQAIQTQDWSTLADLLTDELTDLTQSWQKLLGATAASLYDDKG